MEGGRVGREGGRKRGRVGEEGGREKREVTFGMCLNGRSVSFQN